MKTRNILALILTLAAVHAHAQSDTGSINSNLQKCIYQDPSRCEGFTLRIPLGPEASSSSGDIEDQELQAEASGRIPVRDAVEANAIAADLNSRGHYNNSIQTVLAEAQAELAIGELPTVDSVTRALEGERVQF